MELVAGKGEHVDVLSLYVNVQVACRLYGIRVEDNALFPAHRADLGNGENGADLVVSVHDGHQGGVGSNGRSYLLRGNGAGGAHRQQLHLKALFFQLLQGVEHGVMLKGGGDDVLFALQRTPSGGGDNGLVVGLAAAGGEDDLLGVAAQAPGHGLPGALQGFGGPLAHGVQAGGIAVIVLQTGEHGSQSGVAHFGSGCIVGINGHTLVLLV